MKNMKDKRILVTGGVGFIGSHLCESLRNSGAEVAAYDNFDSYYSRELKERNASPLISAGVRIMEGDIRDEALLKRSIYSFAPDVVVHLAARAGVRPSLEDPKLYVDVNVYGTIKLLEIAREAGIRKIVFASSSSVYGESQADKFRESDSTDHPLSPYGATKKAGELLCYTYHHLFEMSIACLRFFTVYGPRQRPDLAIRKFVRLALDDKELPVFGDGKSSRDYTHIRDILTGIEGAIRWCDAETPRYDIFNLGSSHPVVLNDMIQMIEEAVGKPIRRIALPEQPGDVPRTYADCSKAERELGFKQSVDFREGLREFVEWMKEIDN
jgi:UDP-glucuronate 4-epimerase